MKTKGILIAICCQAFTAGAQQTFTVNGNFSGLKEEKKVLLKYKDNDKTIMDSVIIKNGLFRLTGTITSSPVKATLYLMSVKTDPSVSPLEQYLKMDGQPFYLEGGSIVVQGMASANKALITAGKTQAEYHAFRESIKPERDHSTLIYDQMIPFMVENRDTTAAYNVLYRVFDSLSMTMEGKKDVFIKTHPNSYASLSMLTERSMGSDVASFETLFNCLNPKLRNTKEGRQVSAKLNAIKAAAVGAQARDFKLPGTNGKLVSLSSFKGKYVLLDFWASWCRPCRQENPNLVNAYNQFKDKNFEIIAVSLDHKKENWLKAIAADGLTWKHISDLKGGANKVAELYAITSIPQNFLIDPNGVIIARNLRGEVLKDTLEKVLGSKSNEPKE